MYAFGPLLVAYSSHRMKEKEATWRPRRTDPVIKQYREQISDNDLKILEALNKRVKLVKSLKDYKEAQGLELLRRRPGRLGHHLSVPRQPGPAFQRGPARDLQLILQVAKREARH